MEEERGGHSSGYSSILHTGPGPLHVCAEIFYNGLSKVHQVIRSSGIKSDFSVFWVQYYSIQIYHRFSIYFYLMSSPL